MGGIISTIRDLKVILRDLKITLKFTAKIVLKVHGIVDDMDQTMQELKHTVNGLSSRLPKSPSGDNIDPSTMAYVDDVVNSLEHKADSVKASLSSAFIAVTSDDLIKNTSDAWENLVSHKRLTDVMSKWASIPDGLGDLVKQDCEKLTEILHSAEVNLSKDVEGESKLILEPSTILDNICAQTNFPKWTKGETQNVKDACTTLDNSCSEKPLKETTEKTRPTSEPNATLHNSCAENTQKKMELILIKDISQSISKQPSLFTEKTLAIGPPEIFIEEIIDNKIEGDGLLRFLQSLQTESIHSHSHWITAIAKKIQETQKHRKPKPCENMDNKLLEQHQNVKNLKPSVDIQNGFVSLLLLTVLQGINEHDAFDKCKLTEFITASSPHKEITADKIIHVLNQ